MSSNDHNTNAFSINIPEEVSEIGRQAILKFIAEAERYGYDKSQVKEFADLVIWADLRELRIKHARNTQGAYTVPMANPCYMPPMMNKTFVTSNFEMPMTMLPPIAMNGYYTTPDFYQMLAPSSGMYSSATFATFQTFESNTMNTITPVTISLSNDSKRMIKETFGDVNSDAPNPRTKKLSAIAPVTTDPSNSPEVCMGSNRLAKRQRTSLTSGRVKADSPNESLALIAPTPIIAALSNGPSLSADVESKNVNANASNEGLKDPCKDVKSKNVNANASIAKRLSNGSGITTDGEIVGKCPRASSEQEPKVATSITKTLLVKFDEHTKIVRPRKRNEVDASLQRPYCLAVTDLRKEAEADKDWSQASEDEIKARYQFLTTSTTLPSRITQHFGLHFQNYEWVEKTLLPFLKTKADENKMRLTDLKKYAPASIEYKRLFIRLHLRGDHTQDQNFRMRYVSTSFVKDDNYVDCNDAEVELEYRNIVERTHEGSPYVEEIPLKAAQRFRIQKSKKPVHYRKLDIIQDLLQCLEAYRRWYGHFRRAMGAEKYLKEYIHKKISYHLGGHAFDGCHVAGSTYSELAAGSQRNLVTFIEKHTLLNGSHTVMDIGSGTGSFLFRIALETNCKAIGIECVHERMLLAYTNVVHLISSCDCIPEILNTNVYLSWENVLTLQSFPPDIHLVYCFDQAFSSTLVRHIANLIHDAGVEWVLSCKENSVGCKHLWEQQGYELVEKIVVRKGKTASTNTLGLYRRNKEATPEPVHQDEIEKEFQRYGKIPLHLPLQEKDLGTRASDYFALPREEKLRQMIQMSDRITREINSHKDRRKTRAKRTFVPCKASEWRRCRGDCQTCTQVFSPKEQLLVKRFSPINNCGHFATSVITKGNLLLHLDKENPTMINRSCSPNVHLQIWTESGTTKPEFHSVVASRDIKIGEEITFGLDGNDRHQCQCTKCKEKPCILALMMARYETDEDSKRARSKQLVRDSTRCLATERECNVQVYTVDKRESDQELFSKTYHTLQDVNARISRIPQKLYREILLDWYWMLDTYLMERLGKKFFDTTLLELARLLDPSSGSMYLPLTPKLFVNIFSCLQKPSMRHLRYHLLLEDDMVECAMWVGTKTVASNADFMHKREDQHRCFGLSEKTITHACAAMNGDVRSKEVISEWKKHDPSAKAIFMKIFWLRLPASASEAPRFPIRR
jgi:hypothetical protein